MFVNRGLVEVAAGAAWTGGLATGAGGTVRGAGSVSGGLTFSSATASLRPGTAAAPGRLTVADTGVTLTSGTTLFARVNGLVAGTGHDQLAVLGTVNLGGATLSVTAGGAFTPAASDLVFLVTNDGTDAVSGAFAGLPERATVSLGAYLATIRYAADATTLAAAGGNDIALTNFAPVPEPALLLPLAAVGLAGLRRARAARA